MREIVITDLQRDEQERVRDFLLKKTEQGALEGLFWLPVPDEFLSEEQKKHDKCGPFHFSIELKDESVFIELLIRSKSNLHCSCIHYAYPHQRDFLFSFVDSLIQKADIKA